MTTDSALSFNLDVTIEIVCANGVVVFLDPTAAVGTPCPGTTVQTTSTSRLRRQLSASAKITFGYRVSLP